MAKRKVSESMKDKVISIKRKVIDPIWEVPVFYRILHTTLAGREIKVIGGFLKKEIPKKTKTILDQGCGTGEYALLFGNKYTGLDNSKVYIESAQKKFPGRFILGDALKMDQLKDNGFDVTFAVGLHHHLSDKQATQAFNEALRVTKKGGKMVIIDAMLPKNALNIPGFVLRKLDRGGNVRKAGHTLKLLPKNLDYEWGIISAFPFDYLTIVSVKRL